MEKDKCYSNSQKKATNIALKIYRSVSLFPIHSKVFERNIYNKMFPYFIENNLTSENQSGFKKFYSKDSITHEIFYSFHDNYEITKLEVYVYIYLYLYISIYLYIYIYIY